MAGAFANQLAFAQGQICSSTQHCPRESPTELRRITRGSGGICQSLAGRAVRLRRPLAALGPGRRARPKPGRRRRALAYAHSNSQWPMPWPSHSSARAWPRRARKPARPSPWGSGPCYLSAASMDIYTYGYFDRGMRWRFFTSFAMTRRLLLYNLKLCHKSPRTC